MPEKAVLETAPLFLCLISRSYWLVCGHKRAMLPLPASRFPLPASRFPLPASRFRGLRRMECLQGWGACALYQRVMAV
ncbi:hypothetical protein AD944_03270 [Acetobacter tropicalis]|nr:hypothetical protein AD944_03270 [Acetobacter tropicalis]